MQESIETTEGIKDAFVLHYAELSAIAFGVWSELTFYGAGQIMHALAANLWRYRRAPDSRFLEWATAWVRRETRRHKFLVELFTTSHRLIFASIDRSLFLCPGEDWAVEPRDYEMDLFVHLLQNPRKLDALADPKRAKTTTLLYALTRSRMRAVRSKLSDRHAMVTRAAGEICCEIADPPQPEEIREEFLAA